MADAAVLDPPRGDAPAATEPAVAAAEPAVTWDADPRLAPPTTPPTAEPPASAEPPKAAEPDAQQGAEPPAAVPDWKAKLDAGDADLLQDLLRHPKLAGHVGTLADNLARQKADVMAKAQRDAELDQAAQADPDNPLAQARLAERQKQTEANQAAVAQMAGVQAAQAGVATFLKALPQEARDEIAKLAPEGKAYGQPGDLPSGLAEYMADVAKGYAAAEVAKARATWEKETLPGLRKEIQAEELAKEPAPDLGTTAQAAGGASGLTREKYQNMTAAEARKLASTPAGKAQIDALWAEVLTPPKG